MSANTTTTGEQSGEDPTEPGTSPVEYDRRLRWGANLIAVAGFVFVANGIAMLYRAFFSSGFELGVHTLGGVTRAELAETNPAILSYITHLHVNVAGLMIPVGIAMMALAWYGIRNGQRWALATSVALPVVFLAHSLPVHQTAEFSFHALMHLGPAAVGAPVLIVGAILAYRGLQSGDRSLSVAEEDHP